MQSYGIVQLLTFNGDHFRVFLVVVMDPASL
jgi:hypothetical protein